MLTSPTHSASSCIATRLKPAWRNLVCSMSRSSTSRCSVQDHGSVTIQAPTPVTGCGRRRTNYNKFTVIGCNTLAHIGRVVSVCHDEDSLVDDSCSGIGRCQTSIPENLTYYDVQFDANFNSSSIWEFSPCSHAMMLEASWFKFHEPSYITTNQLQNKTDGWAPMGVDRAIGNETCEVAVLNQNSHACISATSVCLNSTNGPGYLRVDGGFDYQETDYEETHNIVILPDYASLPFPSVELPEKVRLAVDAILIAEGAERKEQLAAWTAEKKKVSAYVMNLQQINSGVVVPPSGWKCCKCDKTDNLWLNLTDGMILCGRRNWDGSGGNNHAIEHYNETKYPLAVKLGTIAADLEGADVFSYPEDDTVEDPLLAQHLAFFGIDFSSLQKTEMTTAERELDQNTNFDWNRIQESGQEVEPLFGPGYTGLVNLGNSCYMASTIQVVFTTRAFISRYYERQSLKMAFAMATSDPTLDLNMQLTKLAHGLLSGKYSVPVQEKQEGVPPRMFKTVIAASHPEFSSMRQQDALEFFLHFLDQVERVNSGKPELDPSRSFKFIIEERLQCPSGKVAYNKRSDYILSLSIPLHEATNKEQLEAFHKMKAERKLEVKDINRDEIVRPRVPLEACLASFSAPEEVHDFYSTSLNAKTTAIKTATFATFPDYLVLHMRKFVMEEGWVPKKLDVYIDVPDVIDITHMRGKGLQPGEELLPETGPDGDVEHTHLVASEDIVSKLAAMGFHYLHCQKAAINTANAGVEEAMTWLLSHMNDPDIDDPISHRSDAMELQFVDETSVETLISFGFQEDVARKALKASGGDIEKATDWIFSQPEASASADTDATSSGMQAGDPGVPDGIGRYKLMALVSRIGTSTHCGHYVAHVHKDGRWVIFNDSKVGASVDPPKDMGYLYFYERIDG